MILEPLVHEVACHTQMHKVCIHKLTCLFPLWKLISIFDTVCSDMRNFCNDIIIQSIKDACMLCYNRNNMNANI